MKYAHTCLAVTFWLVLHTYSSQHHGQNYERWHTHQVSGRSKCAVHGSTASCTLRNTYTTNRNASLVTYIFRTFDNYLLQTVSRESASRWANSDRKVRRRGVSHNRSHVRHRRRARCPSPTHSGLQSVPTRFVCEQSLCEWLNCITPTSALYPFQDHTIEWVPTTHRSVIWRGSCESEYVVSLWVRS